MYFIYKKQTNDECLLKWDPNCMYMKPFEFSKFQHKSKSLTKALEETVAKTYHARSFVRSLDYKFHDLKF